MFKKIISPLIYIAFLIPIFIGTIFLLAIVEKKIGFSFGYSGHAEMLVFILILSTLLWPANHIMIKFEKLQKPEILDHFRQAVLYYVLIIFAVMFFLRFDYGTGFGLGDAYMLMILMISVSAVVINALFLFGQHVRKIL
ncbi:MAG: hypothetical protein UY07_C0018G0017 [Parcubacteria group bacterium GW2011_GWA1_47_8]|nr:MAG: hypothetical protein UY07_C0018G0017 [Parcubacteria group bacterium GW2011_GWA1_47_8]